MVIEEDSKGKKPLGRLRLQQGGCVKQILRQRNRKLNGVKWRKTGMDGGSLSSRMMVSKTEAKEKKKKKYYM